MKDAKEVTTARDSAQDKVIEMVSTRIRETMTAAGMTYRDVADEAGISSGTVSRLLSGSDVKVSTLVAIAATLKLQSIEEVFGDVPSRLTLDHMRDAQKSDRSASRPKSGPDALST